MVALTSSVSVWSMSSTQAQFHGHIFYMEWISLMCAPERIPHDEYGRTETGIKYCKWLVSLPPLWCQCFTSFTLFNIWWVDDLTDADEPQGLIPPALFPSTFLLPLPFIILLLIPDCGPMRPFDLSLQGNHHLTNAMSAELQDDRSAVNQSLRLMSLLLLRFYASSQIYRTVQKSWVALCVFICW